MPRSKSAIDASAAELQPEDFASRHIPLEAQSLPVAGEAHVWFLDLARLARPLRGALDGHAGADDPAPFTAGQLRFARRFYLRLLLGSYLGLPGKAIKINRRNRGKPVLDATVHEENLHFSMAKSGDRLLIGFSTSCYLGVDLEPAQRRVHNALGVAQRYFSPAEAAALAAFSSAKRDAAFLRAWACKEAVVKASGQGIANQLCRFTVEMDPARPPAMLAYDDPKSPDWSLALLCPDTDFLGALAARTAGLTLRPFRLLPASVAKDE